MKLSNFLAGLSIALLALLAFTAPYIWELDGSNVDTEEVFVPDSVVSTPPPKPELLYGFPKDSSNIIEERIRRNQTLSVVLGKYDVDQQVIHDLAQASVGVFDLRKIKPNRKITLFLSPDSIGRVKAAVYESSDLEYVVFNLEDSLQVEKVIRQPTVIERTAAGVIDASLYESMQDLNLSPQLTNDFADIFAWQLDFFHLYPGDKFKVIFEEEYIEEKAIGIRAIKGAYFEHNGNPYYAINYNQGSGFDFFDEEGKSLHKALLRYPVQFSRISSRYSGRRFHPVLKRYRAHLGTDFAAPRGTPIRTVGDGIVVEARYHRGNGNYVKVKHNGNYTTGYLHMSKIAKGIRPGVKVKQGQTIGEVGSTGLAKGNHVCFRFWKNGVQVDALKIELPPSEPIDSANVDAFERRKGIILQALDTIQYPVEKQLLATLETAGD